MKLTDLEHLKDIALKLETLRSYNARWEEIAAQEGGDLAKQAEAAAAIKTNSNLISLAIQEIFRETNKLKSDYQMRVRLTGIFDFIIHGDTPLVKVIDLREDDYIFFGPESELDTQDESEIDGDFGHFENICISCNNPRFFPRDPIKEPLEDNCFCGQSYLQFPDGSVYISAKEFIEKKSLRGTDWADIRKRNVVWNGQFDDADANEYGSAIDYMESQFSKLVGLENVKQEIRQQANLIEIQVMRDQAGLKNFDAPSRHLVFSGNPGTGKTAFARIVAGLYKRLGILKTDRVVEVDRSGLVAGYVGHTALKAKEVFESALDGVLFIDEAYTLAKEGGAFTDFGQEAIETILKLMEDHRDRVVVIVAGYGDKMNEFISSNPGLASRFNRRISFPDYSDDELIQILGKIAEENNYALEEGVRQFVGAGIRQEKVAAGNGFGNARYIRNLFERVVQNQATRLMNAAKLPSREELMQLRVEDFRAAAGDKNH